MLNTWILGVESNVGVHSSENILFIRIGFKPHKILKMVPIYWLKRFDWPFTLPFKEFSKNNSVNLSASKRNENNRGFR